MRMVPQTILMWCLLTAFLPCVITAALRLNSEGEKKLSVRLQNRLRRDLCAPKISSDSTESTDTETTTIHKSDESSGRVKRSCILLTCSVHDLAYQINLINAKTIKAPPHKISPCGYGRRRRRALHFQHATIPMQEEAHRIITVPQIQSSEQKLT